MDCWINGLLQIKELCKEQQMEKSKTPILKSFLLYLTSLSLNSNQFQAIFIFLKNKNIFQKIIR
jgi:hypothetical protein